MRCACGYDESWHPDGRCPLCACGAVPAQHGTEGECPGKPRSETTGKFPTLRRGSLRAADEPAAYRLRADDVYVPSQRAAGPSEVPTLPPRVPARPVAALSEIAPRATALGNAAADLGWEVTPYYWQGHDGTERSTLAMVRGELLAQADWDRAPGGSWRSVSARAGRRDARPEQVGVKRLTALIKEMGRS